MAEHLHNKLKKNIMKKLSFRTSALTFGVAVVITIFGTSCTSSSDKVADSKENVREEQAELNKANQEYLKDVEAYRRETADRIVVNNEQISDLNARIEEVNANNRDSYKQKVADLERKNIEMKTRLDNFEAEGKDEWKQFKTEFDRDMANLGNAFADLGRDNAGNQ